MTRVGIDELAGSSRVFLRVKRTRILRWELLMEPKDIQARRDQSLSLNFGLIFLAFVVANAWVLQMSTSSDLGSAQQVAMTVFVVVVNFMILLGFDNAVQSWKAISEDFGNDESKWAELQRGGPYGLFRVIVAIVPVAVTITTVIAIFS